MEILTVACVLIGIIGVSSAAIMIFKARKTSLRELSAREALEQVIENLGEGFYRTSLDGEPIRANPALIAISGFTSETELISAIGKKFGGWYVDPSRREEFKTALLRDGKVRNFVSEVYRDKTQERIWVSENARLVVDPLTKKPSHYEGTVIEITDIILRIHEQERLAKLTSQVPGGLFQLVRDAKGAFSVPFASSGFSALLDLQTVPPVFDLPHFLSLIHPEDLSNYRATLRQSRKSGRIWTHDFRVVTDSGKTKWLKVQATPEKKSDTGMIWHGLLQDISLTKADEAEFKSMAYHDSLTNLPNRRALIERMEQKIAACDRRNEYAALLFIDLDTFKSLNDTHGHDVGDLLLIEIANRLKQSVRRSDVVARLAGDEFVVLLDGMGTSKAEAVAKTTIIAQKIATSFDSPFRLGNLAHLATASIGGVTFNGDQGNADTILRLADSAMYDVKKSGRNSFKVFDDEGERTANQQSGLSFDVIGLTERDELELRLQPQFDRDGQICGAEALVRWNHPVQGLLTADAFMPLAEKCGQSASINLWMLKKAFAVLQTWQQNVETSRLTISMSLRLQQFSDNGFAGELVALSKLQNVDLSKLTLQLNEGLVARNREVSLRMLKKLKHAGIRLSLEDFGVEYSSLSLLADMQLDEIKINGNFVKSMMKGPQDKVLVKSIMALADALGLSTVGVQVETRAQEKLLMEYGCKQFQGFLYGGALSQVEFDKTLAQNGIRFQRKAASEMAA
jgi:diguanylate cyclase (GGDEF)-like protein/PAS domain S-box-containing protein